MLKLLQTCLVFQLLFSAAPAEDWPHWRGLQRNGTTSENSGWNGAKWPAGGKLWQVNVGQGSSSPIVVGGKIYTLGWSDGRDYVRCLDAASGKVLLEQSYPCPQYGRKSLGDKGIYSGASSTPEYHQETQRLYTLSTDGDLHCWMYAITELKHMWGFNLYERYDTPVRPQVGRSGHRDYGYTSSPLAWSDSLIVEVGAAAGNLVAFDYRTGKEQWKSEAKDPPGHTGGPVPIVVENAACVAVHTFEGLLVTRIDKGHEGKTVATYPWRTDFANNIATLAVHESDVVLTSHYNHNRTARIHVSLDRGATKVWEQPYSSKVCSPLIVGGHVYFAWQQLHCLDFATGKLKWQGGKVSDPGSCIATADQRMIVWGNNGDLMLAEMAERSPGAYRELAALKGVFHTDAWPHVVLSGGKLFCKDREGNLACFELAAEKKAGKP